MMGIARSTYYDKPAISIDDTALVETMVVISDSFEAYGYRRMQAALRHRGFVVNHKKIRRLMREHDLQPRRRRRYVATTDGDHDLPIFPNLAKDMVPDAPNQLWVADLTYVAIQAGFVYVAVILDAWSRKVVGYAIARSIDVRRPCAPPSTSEDRRPAACITPIAARNTRPGTIGRLSPRMASSDRWAAGAIPTITPRPKAS